jgi:hypothetical protein
MIDFICGLDFDFFTIFLANSSILLFGALVITFTLDTTSVNVSVLFVIVRWYPHTINNPIKTNILNKLFIIYILV